VPRKGVRIKNWTAFSLRSWQNLLVARNTEDGKAFSIFKFRTMINAVSKFEPAFRDKGDLKVV